MSAVEIIAEIEKLPKDERLAVIHFVDAQLRAEEDRRDNEAADAALAESGDNIPWDAAKKRLGWA